MSTKHTPGPWITCPNGGDDADPTANFVCAPNGARAGRTLAECYGKERAANARLIAAAPDLLKALKALADAADNPDLDTIIELQRARAAIAKAEGRS